MRRVFQFHKKYPGKITVLLAFSFFVSGCHIVNESATVTQIATKKKKLTSTAPQKPKENRFQKTI